MEQDRAAERFFPLSESLSARLFTATVEFLAAGGYVQYEISNFARSGAGGAEAGKSRHNQKYWSFAPYLGLGPSAHSFIAPVRSWNVRSVTEYIRSMERGRVAREQEVLTEQQQMIESIYLGLRTTEGICLADFDRKFGVSFIAKFARALEELEESGLAAVGQGRCALSRKGMLLLDSIAGRLIETLS
ncbi:MAG: hypothetical protein Q8P24_10460 [Desulfobacterales bacterium]|nr:hypothetical protein [Desulfobacterales bacterium]